MQAEQGRRVTAPGRSDLQYAESLYGDAWNLAWWLERLSGRGLVAVGLRYTEESWLDVEGEFGEAVREELRSIYEAKLAAINARLIAKGFAPYVHARSPEAPSDSTAAERLKAAAA